MTHVLPDVLRPSLRLVVCGTGAGETSGRIGQYYAGPRNKFWKTLYTVGLTPRRLDPAEYHLLPEFGIGLTDLSKSTAGADNLLKSGDLDIGRFRQVILELQPRVLAFNGKKAAKSFLKREVSYGKQLEFIDQTAIFVAPSTSGRASAYWDESFWHELARLVAP